MLTILIYLLLLYVVVRIYLTKKQNKRIGIVVDLIRILDDKEAFFIKADEEIAAAESDELKTKFQIIKLWGKAHHKEYDGFIDLLNEIDPIELLTNTKVHNDDSLFYLFLATPNILFADGRKEEEDAVREKLKEKEDIYKDRLDYNMYLACDDYYNNRNDKGYPFFVSLMEGDYAEYVYAKQLIGLYKQMASVFLMNYYKDKDIDKYNEMTEVAESFYEMRIGKQFIENMDVELPGSFIEEQVAKNSSDVIEAEVIEEEETPVTSEGSESGTSFVDEEDEEDQ